MMPLLALYASCVGIVGGMVVAMYLPIFDMMNAVQ